MSEAHHTPVLLQEVLQYLDPQPGENFIDCTVGMGGHAMAILERTAPTGKVLGIDWDGGSLKELESHMADHKARERLVLAQGNFADIREIIARKKFGPVAGVLMDLGWSTWQLEEGGRGMSFLRDEDLDMRLSRSDGPDSENPNAADIVNEYSQEELETILRDYGEERFARRIANGIVERRRSKRIERTADLARIVAEAVPARYTQHRLHPATRTFQALRIATNSELENLQRGLAGTLDVCSAGRIAVISFHSLEDRIVKHFFRDRARSGRLHILTKKPIVASAEEVAANPRARSAKLRVVEMLL